MQLSPSPRTLVIGIALFGAGCSDPVANEPPPPDEDHRCVVDGAQAAEPRTAYVGSRVGGSFEPYAAGQTVELVWGFQGGVMITPVVGVEAAATDADRICASIRLSHTIVGAEVDDLNPGVSLQTWLHRSGGRLLSSELDDLVGYVPEPLAGQTLRLSLEVDGPVTGQTDVEVMLAAPADGPPR